MLRPAGHGRLDLGLAQVGADLLPDRREVLLAGRRALGDQVHDLVVDLGVERRERQVLELPLDRVHAEPVGQRRVDLERLAGLLLRGGRRDELPGPGVVQAVGELDDQHPDVAGHRDDHLAHGLGLRRVAVGDLVQLGHAVDEHRDLGTELATQLVERVVGVLDGVVQQRGGQRRRRHAQLGEDRRDGDGVRDVRVAALAQLAAVRLLGHDVRLLDDREVGLRVVGARGLQDGLERRERGTAAGAEPAQARAHATRRASRSAPAGRPVSGVRTSSLITPPPTVEATVYDRARRATRSRSSTRRLVRAPRAARRSRGPPSRSRPRSASSSTRNDSPTTSAPHRSSSAHRRGGRAAGRQHVVDHEHARARRDGRRVDLDRRRRRTRARRTARPSGRAACPPCAPAARRRRARRRRARRAGSPRASMPATRSTGPSTRAGDLVRRRPRTPRRRPAAA